MRAAIRFAGALAALATALVMLFGCVSSDPDIMGRQIRNCILSGGHPHLGPDDTIICLFD